jgi:hypothetical protein
VKLQVHTSTRATEDEDDGDLGVIKGGCFLHDCLRFGRLFLGSGRFETMLFSYLLEDGN